MEKCGSSFVCYSENESCNGQWEWSCIFYEGRRGGLVLPFSGGGRFDLPFGSVLCPVWSSLSGLYDTGDRLAADGLWSFGKESAAHDTERGQGVTVAAGVTNNILNAQFIAVFPFGIVAERREKGVLFMVEDNGMGIDLCWKLCDKLGIGIWTDSRYGEGAKMMLEFPVSSYAINHGNSKGME